MAEGAQCHCTFMYAIPAIVGHFSPDFESLNYEYPIKIFAELGRKPGLWARTVDIVTLYRTIMSCTSCNINTINNDNNIIINATPAVVK